MIGLDTNVLVRYFAQDDPRQSCEATKLIESLSEQNPGFVSLVAMIELVWVMQGRYDATRTEIITILDTLLRVKTLHIQDAKVVMTAVRVYANSTADFADCLIERSGYDAQCFKTVTFDIKAAKLGQQMNNRHAAYIVERFGVPKGSRTPVLTVKG